MNLLEYKKKRGFTYRELAKKIGIGERHLKFIIQNRSPHVEVLTCLKILTATGLKPDEYLDGLEAYQKLTQRSRK